MKKGSTSKYSLEERMKIVRDYEESNLSIAEITKKYGLSCSSLVSVWRSRLSKTEKYRTFVASKSSNPFDESVMDVESMKPMSREELEKEIVRLQKELEWSRLETKSLNVMIDIAEKHGMQIRKKSGAKQ